MRRIREGAACGAERSGEKASSRANGVIFQTDVHSQLQWDVSVFITRGFSLQSGEKERVTRAINPTGLYRPVAQHLGRSVSVPIHFHQFFLTNLMYLCHIMVFICLLDYTVFINNKTR